MAGCAWGELIDPTSSRRLIYFAIPVPLFPHDKLHFRTTNFEKFLTGFFRTKEQYIGIELSVAGTIVQAHNGPIRAERGFGC